MNRFHKATIDRIIRFLIVDDNIHFRIVLREILLDIGEVEVTWNGAEALERTRERTFDVIITDINMPLMGGIEFYQQAVEIHPALRDRFVFCSNELTTEQTEFLEEQGLHLLQKPFGMNRLLDVIKDILQATEDE